MVAAAKVRQQAAASLLLDLAKFYEHVRHDHKFPKASLGLLVRFIRRLAVPRGRQVCYLSLLGCNGATTAAKLMLATLLENSGNTSPELQAVERGRRHFGARCRIPQEVQAITAEAARLLVEGLQARDQTLSKGKSKVLIDGTDSTTFCNSWRGLGSTSATRHAMWGRSAAGQAEAGRSSSRGGWRGQRGARNASGRGTHSQFDSHWLECRVLWGSEVLGFTPTQLQAIRVDAAKATYQLSRGQNAATTMMAHAQSAGAKNVDPAFRHHRQV